LSSCDSSGYDSIDEILDGQIEFLLNNNSRVPLAAKLTLDTKEKCSATITVLGDQQVVRSFETYQLIHNIPIIGLYADTFNQVLVELKNQKGKIYRDTLSIQTEPLPSFFPEITIGKIDRDRMEPGLHLFELLVPNNNKFDSYSICFDDHGKVRWYMDMSEMRRIAFSIPRMKNGNAIYVSWIDVFELNQLGETIKQWELAGFAGDHDIKELPNGNFLMGASSRQTTILQNGVKRKTRYDQVVEMDRNTLAPQNQWDMRHVLDVDRDLLTQELGRDNYFDWFHINSVNFDQDHNILVSGRNQGVVKLDQQQNTKWILAPHKGWGLSGIEGKGPETAPYLLKAVDQDGQAYDQEIQDGIKASQAFEWPTGQHSLQVLDNGNLLLFDNGFGRNLERRPTYSRAVEYRIDEENKTIQQVWQYGKERGLDMFSAITSSVQVLPQTGNRLITSGYIRASKDAPHAKMVEVSYPDNKEVFEADIYFKNTAPPDVMQWAKFDVVYKGHRFDLVQ